jgi:hypothetical protein
MDLLGHQRDGSGPVSLGDGLAGRRLPAIHRARRGFDRPARPFEQDTARCTETVSRLGGISTFTAYDHDFTISIRS